MSAKSNNIDLNEELMAMWREDRPSGTSCFHCI